MVQFMDASNFELGEVKRWFQKYEVNMPAMLKNLFTCDSLEEVNGNRISKQTMLNARYNRPDQAFVVT